MLYTFKAHRNILNPVRIYFHLFSQCHQGNITATFSRSLSLSLSNTISGGTELAPIMYPLIHSWPLWPHAFLFGIIFSFPLFQKLYWRSSKKSAIRLDSRFLILCVFIMLSRNFWRPSGLPMSLRSIGNCPCFHLCALTFWFLFRKNQEKYGLIFKKIHLSFDHFYPLAIGSFNARSNIIIFWLTRLKRLALLIKLDGYFQIYPTLAKAQEKICHH